MADYIEANNATSKEIRKQMEFMEWLKEKELYFQHESADTMNKMFKVWKTLKEDYES